MINLHNIPYEQPMRPQLAFWCDVAIAYFMEERKDAFNLFRIRNIRGPETFTFEVRRETSDWVPITRRTLESWFIEAQDRDIDSPYIDWSKIEWIP